MHSSLLHFFSWLGSSFLISTHWTVLHSLGVSQYIYPFTYWQTSSLLSSVKTSIQPKAIYKFNVLFIKITITLTTHRSWTNNPKICLEPQRCQISKAILRRNNTGGIMIPVFKLYYKAIVMKAVWYWHKEQTHRSIE